MAMNNGLSGSRGKKTLLVIIGLATGLILLYFAFRDISRHDLLEGLKQMNPLYLLPGCLVLVIAQFMRALRFGVIVKPFCALNIKELWDLINLWGGMNMVLPARLAEFVRPYLLMGRGVSFAKTLGAVMVERIFDLFGLLLLLAVLLWRSPGIAKAYAFLGVFVLVTLLGLYTVILVILWRRDWFDSILGWFLAWLPERWADLLRRNVNRVVDGCGIMASPRHTLLVFGCSVMIWLLFSALTYIFMLAFGMKAPFLVAVTTQVLLCIGVAVPSAPGFIGTFHAACRVALELFGIQATMAVSFAVAYHLFSVIAAVLLGLVSYWTGNFQFDRDLLRRLYSDDSGSSEE